MDTELLLAIGLGLFFGFALNRVGASNPNYVINMLRLRDLHLMKVILFAIGLSSLLLLAGIALGFIDAGHLSIKSAYIGVVVGGALLGIGFAMAGYCPGTGLCALATGRKDAFVFVLGGLLGAFVYMLVYGMLKDTFLMDKIAGGSAMLADAGSESAEVLLKDIPLLVFALVHGIVLMVVAALLPKKIL